MSMEAMPSANNNAETVKWTNPDGTVGSGTPAEKQEAIESWDSK